MAHPPGSPGDAGLLPALAAAVGSEPQDRPFASPLPAAARSPGAAAGGTPGGARVALLEGFDDSERQDLAIDPAAYAPSPAPAPVPAAGAHGEQTPAAQTEHENLADVCLAACGDSTPHPGLVDALRRAQVPRGLLVDWSYNGPRTRGGGAALDLSAAALRDEEPESGLPSGPQLEAALRALLGGESGGYGQVLLLRHVDLSGQQVGGNVFTYLLGVPERLGDYLRLISLRLSECSLTDDDFKAFCSQLVSPLYKRLERLDLSHNPLGRRQGSGGWHGAEDVGSMGPVWNEAPLRLVDLSFTELSSAALSYQLHRLRECKPFESPGTLACLEVLKVGPPGDMPELDDSAVDLLGAIICKAPQLQALELFGLPEAQRGMLEEKWREAKGEDACFAGPVGDAGAFRLSTLPLDQLCTAEVAPTEHVLPGPVTPGEAAQVLQQDDEADFPGQQQLWEEPAEEPERRAAGAAGAHRGLPPQRRQQRGRGQQADPDGELHEELAGGTQQALQEHQRRQLPSDAAAPGAAGAVAGQKRKGEGGGGRRSQPSAFAGEQRRATQPAVRLQAAPSSGGGGGGHFFGGSAGAAGWLLQADGGGAARRRAAGSRGGGGSSKPRAARAYGKEDELDYLQGPGVAIDGEESPAAQSAEEEEEEEAEAAHAVGSKRASQGHRLLKQGELARDDVMGRRYRKRARELVEKIPSEEDQKRARRALSNWDRMGDMPWDRKRWQNPIKGANEAVVVHLLCLVHFLARNGMALEFPIPDHVWESVGAPNGYYPDGCPPNGQEAQQQQQQQQQAKQQQQDSGSEEQASDDEAEVERSSASGSDSDPEAPAGGRAPRGGSTARCRTQIIETDSEDEGGPPSSGASPPGGSEAQAQRSKRQRGDGGGGGCRPGPGAHNGDEGGDGGAGSGGGGSSPEVHGQPMGSNGSQGASGGSGSPLAEAHEAREHAVPHYVPTAQADAPPPTIELQQRFRQQLGSVAASPLQQPDLGPDGSGSPGQRLALGVSSAAAAEEEGQEGCPQAPASMRTELAPQQLVGSGEAGAAAVGAAAGGSEGGGGARGKKASSRIERERRLLEPWGWDERKEQHPPNAEHYGPAEGKREHRTLLAPAEYVAAITDSQPQPAGLDALGSEWQPSPSQLTAGSPLGAHGSGRERRGGADAATAAAAAVRSGSRGGGGGGASSESSSDSEDDMPLAQLWAAKHAGSAGRGGSAALHDVAASPAAGRGAEPPGPDAAAPATAAADMAAVAAAAAAAPGVPTMAALPAAGPPSAPAPSPSQPAAASGAAASEAGAAASPAAAPQPPALAGPGASEARSPLPQLGAPMPGTAAAAEEGAQQQEEEEVLGQAVIDLVSPVVSKPAGAAQDLGAGPGADGSGTDIPEMVCIPDSEDQDEWGALPRL